MVAGGVAHRQPAAVVADQQPGDHHRQRPGHMQLLGQFIAAEHAGQGDQHLDLVVVHRAQQQEHRRAQRGTQQQSAARLQRQQVQRVVHGRGFLPDHDAQQQGEHHHADAVVEQRFARDHQADVVRRTGRLEDADHRDRIGRRDQRTEHQAVAQRQRQAHQRQGPVQGKADDQGRQQRAEHREDAHLPAIAAQQAHVDMQGAGEQQHRQHALHQHIGEVDRLQEAFLVVVQRTEAETVRAEQEQRQQHRDYHHADGGRQADETDVDPRRQRGDHEAGDGDIEHAGLDGKRDRPLFDQMRARKARRNGQCAVRGSLPRRRYNVLRLIPSLRAARAMLPPQASTAARIAVSSSVPSGTSCAASDATGRTRGCCR